MLTRNSLLAALLVFASSGIAVASDSGKCNKCHEPDEFEGMSAADISADLRDTGIAEHKKLSLSDEQVAALAAELSGG